MCLNTYWFVYLFDTSILEFYVIISLYFIGYFTKDPDYAWH